MRSSLDAFSAPSLYREINLSYLPLPNVVDTVVTDTIDLLPPPHLVPTAFMIPILPDGRIVFANNRRRGIEFTGGHIEKLETAPEAAVREADEEAGVLLRHGSIRHLGYLRSHSEGEEPEGYRYPFPFSFQQFFTGLVDRLEPFVENDECLQPIVLSFHETVAVFAEGKPSHIVLIRAALERLGIAGVAAAL